MNVCVWMCLRLNWWRWSGRTLSPFWHHSILHNLFCVRMCETIQKAERAKLGFSQPQNLSQKISQWCCTVHTLMYAYVRMWVNANKTNVNRANTLHALCGNHFIMYTIYTHSFVCITISTQTFTCFQLESVGQFIVCHKYIIAIQLFSLHKYIIFLNHNFIRVREWYEWTAHTHTHSHPSKHTRILSGKCVNATCLILMCVNLMTYANFHWIII